MRAAALVLSLVLLAPLAGGCKGDREKCAQAAQHYAELDYWDRENKNIAKLPAQEQEAERKRKIVAFNRDVDAQFDNSVRNCVSANNDDQVDCIIAAKTKDEALECAPIA